MNEFIINDFLTLKLEEGKTNIYVNGELFIHCKYLMLNNPVKKIQKFDEIDSIDEVADLLGWWDGGQEGVEYEIDQETEFWGHCSNLQVWYEHKYDTHLLHSNLSFSLLKQLSKVGDPIAKRVLNKEVTKRFSAGYPTTISYIFEEKLLELFSPEEQTQLLMDLFAEFIGLKTDALENYEHIIDLNYNGDISTLKRIHESNQVGWNNSGALRKDLLEKKLIRKSIHEYFQIPKKSDKKQKKLF